MSNDPIPADVRDFLTRYIESIAQLESLLLLHGRPGSEWTVAEVAGRLYVSPELAGALLARLADDTLLVRQANPDVFVYGPGSMALAQAVDRVASTYRTHLVPITNLIHAKASTRVHEFANAFKLRRGE